MRIPLSWLRDFVTVPVGVQELASGLDMRGFEVGAIEPAPEGSPDGDAVLDLEITTNRPDCLSMTGIAREIAAMYATELRQPAVDGGSAATESDDGLPSLGVTLEDTELCPRYAAAVAAVTVGDSPDWLARRLEAAGVRAINNIVDVTNYVLLELGQPMHAFDFERLGGAELRIRRATAGERVRTLDGQMRTLTDEMLVIADAARPQALAGVMGGADSEVSRATRVVALESAYFQPISVRRTSKRIALSTDASYRFERGADISAPVRALERCCALLREIGAASAVGPVIDRYPESRAPLTVRLRHARVEHLLGQTIDPAFVTDILTRLGFTPREVDTGVWDVEAPLRRVDVSREVDLIEEVGRHHGYDRLPSTFPAVDTVATAPDPRIDRDRLARRIAGAGGFSEAVTFAFIEHRAAEAFVDDPAVLATIRNPLSEQFTVLRPSLLPGVIASVAHNRRRERPDVQLFEVATRFTSAGETRGLALAWTGAGTPDHWSQKPRVVDFFDIKGSTEQILSALGVSAPSYATATPPYLVAGRAAEIRAGDAPLGVLGQLAPKVGELLGLDATDVVFVAEIDLDRVADVTRGGGDVRVTPLPRHPSVVRDLSILIAATLPASAVRDTIRSAAPETLIAIREFDRYTGKGIPEGSVSLSLRLTFRAKDRTLTDAEVQQAADAIVAALTAAHDARLR
ncbi:MAG: phenylalanine--tRNA ligase subunit beta [Vicinamibacterales bacterium]|nr:phenylalanine--tRNA ligase subunit beta [Acidobacteriota bacterium]MDP6370983.1 phenylalanine--tRNA ligase subunit beta [Vicinamibacterales bacterium]MDP6607916.1 phenylalanine--tRNA ligase subunit beta [Vicinamibacterales bacterium]